MCCGQGRWDWEDTFPTADSLPYTSIYSLFGRSDTSDRTRKDQKAFLGISQRLAVPRIAISGICTLESYKHLVLGAERSRYQSWGSRSHGRLFVFSQSVLTGKSWVFKLLLVQRWCKCRHNISSDSCF